MFATSLGILREFMRIHAADRPASAPIVKWKLILTNPAKVWTQIAGAPIMLWHFCSTNDRTSGRLKIVHLLARIGLNQQHIAPDRSVHNKYIVQQLPFCLKKESSVRCKIHLPAIIEKSTWTLRPLRAASNRRGLLGCAVSTAVRLTKRERGRKEREGTSGVPFEFHCALEQQFWSIYKFIKCDLL